MCSACQNPYKDQQDLDRFFPGKKTLKVSLGSHENNDAKSGTIGGVISGAAWREQLRISQLRLAVALGGSVAPKTCIQYVVPVLPSCFQ